MLNKESSQIAYKNPHPNFLSTAVNIKGNYSSEADAVIAGNIEGDVHVKGKLKLEKPGYISGKIIAPEMDIAGKVAGELRCEGKITIRNSASIDANIFATILQVEAEATINGELIITEKKQRNGQQSAEK